MNQFIGLFMIALVILYGGCQGWFTPKVIIGGTTINEYEQQQLEKEPTGECSATVTPQAGWVGDTFTGTAIDGANQLCTIYFKYTTDTLWQVYGSGFTDSNGILKVSEVLKTSGQVDVKAVCGDCVTNTVRIYVNVPTDGGDGDGFGGGEPKTYCGSAWFPPTSQAVCSDRDSTCPIGEKCFFHASTMATKAYCACAKPVTFPQNPQLGGYIDNAGGYHPGKI